MMGRTKKDIAKAEMPKAIVTGTLAHIGINADCYVLSNGARVLSQRGIMRALTAGDGAPGGKDFGRMMARLQKNIRGLSVPPGVEILFSLPTGGTAVGRDATWFVDLLKGYKAALRAGSLTKQQEPLGRRADEMLDALAGVALVALIDEATGYEEMRQHGALASLFERLLLERAATWERFWTTDLVRSLCRTYSLHQRGNVVPEAFAGVCSWIYRVILGDELYDEIRRRNPPGHDRDMHHSYFNPALRHLAMQDRAIILAFSDQSRNKHEFKRKMLAHYRKKPYQLGFE
jgi:hypothetical protein